MMMKYFTAVVFAVFSFFGSYAQFIPLFVDTPSTGSRRAILIDNNDVVWTGSSFMGLIRRDNNSVQYFDTSNSGILSNYCGSIGQDSSGKMWAGSLNGVSAFDGISWMNYTVSNSGLPSNTVSAIAASLNGVWLGTNNGLAFFDGMNWTVYNTSNSPILNNDIRCLQIDGSNVYAGTMGGLSVFDGTNWTNWPTGQNGLGLGIINEIEIANGRVWLNTGYTQFLDQGYFISMDSLIDNESVTGQLAIAWSGLTKDQSGNIYTVAYGAERAVFKIDTTLNLSFARLRPQNPGSFYYLLLMDITSTNEIFMVGNSIGTSIQHFQIDTNAFYSPQHWLGLSNDYLDINNVRTRILNRGDMHWDPDGGYAKYEVPKNSGLMPVWCSGLWLGGIDQTGLLHTAAMQYRQNNGYDYYPGPLDTITGSSDSITMYQYDRFWKIDATMIQDFQINYLNGNLQNGTYQLPEAIATWPAHGSGNYSRDLAPFIDTNNDGVYNPYDGDYPELTGHQMLWWVLNDTLGIYSTTDGAAFQFEIHGKAYAFNCPGNPLADEVMNYTTFYQYKIINRSQNTYSDVHAGLFTDFSSQFDDGIGCDSMLNTYFSYNLDNDDDGNWGYGLNPPMMNVTILKGTEAMPSDNLDNNHNGLIDEPNEDNGMSTFVHIMKGSTHLDSPPPTTAAYYYYLKALNAFGDSLTYGGNGYNNPPGTPGIKYMLSGTPYDTGWTMLQTQIWSYPRGLGSSGPFSIAPGESQTIDFAYIFTRDSLNPNGLSTSIAKNTADVQKIIAGFNSGNYPCLTVSLPENSLANNSITLYPNPANSHIFIKGDFRNSNYEIFNITGQLVRNGILQEAGIDIHSFQPGIYLFKLRNEKGVFTARFVKL